MKMYDVVKMLQSDSSWPADTLCIQSSSEALTRNEVFRRAWAHAEIILSSGIRHGQRLGIQLDMSVEFILAVLAAWCAGCSFVPLPANISKARLKMLASEAQLAAVIRRSGPTDDTDLPLFYVSPGRLTFGGSLSGSLFSTEEEAYVLFTSGSTGSPKGVSIARGALSYYVERAIVEYGLTNSGGVAIAQLAPTFDAAITSYVVPLAAQIPILLADRTQEQGGTKRLAVMLDEIKEPIVLKTTPTQLRLLTSLIKSDSLAKLQGIVIVGGEQLFYEDIVPWQRNSKLKIINEYGPTEATVGCVYFEAGSALKSGPVPVGKPFEGTRLFLENSSLEGRGELVIQGPSVANGYISSDGADRFRRVDGIMSYRTGDEVSEQNGLFTFIGRTDRQVKLSGIRVELSEVEAVARTFEGVTACVAFCLENRLCTVIEAKDLLPEDLRALFRQTLPDYMVPEEIAVSEALPMTSHGKVDSESLVEIIRGMRRSEDRPHERIAEAWRSVILCQGVSASDHFFESGGNSILALRLIGLLGTEFKRKIPPAMIFEFPTYGGFRDRLIAYLSASCD